jgi:hypothetical protein
MERKINFFTVLQLSGGKKANFSENVTFKMQNTTPISAVHGINHIFSSNHNKYSRVFWTIAVIVSCAGFFFYLKSSWIKLMYEPEILIRTRERPVDDFAYPAISVCTNLFARRDAINYTDLQSFKRTSLTDRECEIAYANLLWSNLYNTIIPQIWHMCSIEKLAKVDIGETILNTSRAVLETIHIWNYVADDFVKPYHSTYFIRSSIDGVGPCYHFNLLSYSQLFHTDIINDEYKQYQRFLYNRMQVEANLTDQEDMTTWTPEQGYKRVKENRMFNFVSDHKFRIVVKVSPDDFENLVDEQNFRIFFHNPNEILTPRHKVIPAKYNEVCLNLIQVKL